MIRLSNGVMFAWAAAGAEAQNAGQRAIEPEHVLLGLCKIYDLPLDAAGEAGPPAAKLAVAAIETEVGELRNVFRVVGLDSSSFLSAVPASVPIDNVAILSGMTKTGPAAGKPWFMPRQQVINFKYSEPEVDVWGAAACFYNMLTGRFPRDFLAGQDPWQIVLASHAVPILKRNPSIPKGLAVVIDKALIDQPAIPFKTAAELKYEIECVL